MASVVINTRFNNRKAEADLKELQAKAKETAREINAVEKSLGSMPDANRSSASHPRATKR